MPGRPLLVEVSLLVEALDSVLVGTPPLPPLPPSRPPLGAQAQDAWPWGRGRAVPGHPGQQLKHGVQHVAVTLLQLEQPEQGKEAGHSRTRVRPPSLRTSALDKPVPGGTRSPCQRPPRGRGAVWLLTVAHGAAGS